MSSSEKAAWPLSCRNNPPIASWSPVLSPDSRLFIMIFLKFLLQMASKQRPVGKEIGKVKSNLRFGVLVS